MFKKIFIVLSLFFCSVVFAQVSQAQEFQVNKNVSTERWSFTVISVENTMRNRWPVAPKGLNFRILREGFSFWRLKIKADYKDPSAERIEFKGRWVTAVYKIKGDPIPKPSEMQGVIPPDPSLRNKEALFGDVTVGKLDPTKSASFDIEFLFVAPKESKTISSMQVEFLDCEPIQIELKINT